MLSHIPNIGAVPLYLCCAKSCFNVVAVVVHCCRADHRPHNCFWAFAPSGALSHTLINQVLLGGSVALRQPSQLDTVFAWHSQLLCKAPAPMACLCILQRGIGTQQGLCCALRWHAVLLGRLILKWPIPRVPVDVLGEVFILPCLATVSKPVT